MIGRLPIEWREALEELWRRRLRTGLTLLGLVFGVGAIVAMQAIGEGSKREALRLVQGLGLNNLIVKSVSTDEDGLRERRQRSLGLSQIDAQALLAAVPGAEAVAVEKEIKVFEVLSAGQRSDAKASGVSPAFFALSALEAGQGRLLTQADEDGLAAVAVLGHQVAERLFPEGQAVGQAVKLNHVWLRVVGVLADRDLSKKDFEGVQLGLESNRIFVPFASTQARFRFQSMEDEVDRLILRLAQPEQVASSAAVVGAALDQRHAGVEDYQLIVPAQLFRQHQATQRIFRIVMAAIAAVSLLVGGIGIMNIMLANVLERKREIGLLRALGARQRDVTRQFLREAAVICVSGALAGIVFGALLAYAIAWGAQWQVAWAPLPVLLAVLACSAVGLAFGVYPAKQAAQLDPIAALRTD